MTSTVSPARLAAFRVLLRVERDAAFASSLLASDQFADLSNEDRRLAHEIALGVLRWRGELDYVINVTTGRAAERLDLPVRIALWIGLYQIRHLDRIPVHAAVNESVELLKNGSHRRAAPLVNAALRTALRDNPEAPDERVRDPLNRLAIATSHPRWLVDRWSQQFGETDVVALLKANNDHPPAALRINSLRAPSRARVLAELSESGISVRDSTVVPEALVVVSGQAGPWLRAVREGWVYFQDEASQLVARLVASGGVERVLDVCAAPGSKTTLMADVMGNRGQIVAMDLHVSRLRTLVDSCRRLGVTNIATLAADAAEGCPLRDGVVFDRVLVDAPCSGTGTLRRNPEIKWRLSIDDVMRCAALQGRLLDTAGSRVRAGGRLVYSTCSLEPEENERVVGAFLERSPEFGVVESGLPAAFRTREGYLRTYPHRDGADGFFAAVLERRATR